MDANTKKDLFALAVSVIVLITGCKTEGADEQGISAQDLTVIPRNHLSGISLPMQSAEFTSESAASERPWSDEELNAIAQTLSGECYDDKEHDKRLVCEVILNRVSDGRFGDTVYEVVTAENQFVGYWNPLRPVSESDRAVAERTLQDWYNNDCQSLSKYLYFSAGENRENTFYESIEQ